MYTFVCTNIHMNVRLDEIRCTTNEQLLIVQISISPAAVQCWACCSSRVFSVFESISFQLTPIAMQSYLCTHNRCTHTLMHPRTYTHAHILEFPLWDYTHTHTHIHTHVLQPWLLDPPHTHTWPSSPPTLLHKPVGVCGSNVISHTSWPVLRTSDL